MCLSCHVRLSYLRAIIHSLTEAEDASRIFTSNCHSLASKPHHDYHNLELPMVHHWDHCLDLFTSRSVCVPSQMEHSRFSFNTRSNSTHDTGSFRRSFDKVIFTTAEKKKGPEWSFSLQSSISCQWLSDGSAMLHAVVLPANCNLSVRHQTREPSQLDCSFMNKVRKRKAEAQEQNNWKGKQSAREAIQNDFLTLVK